MSYNRVWVNPNIVKPGQARINRLDTQVAELKNRIAEKAMTAKEKRSFDIALEAFSTTDLSKDNAEVPIEKAKETMKAFEARNIVSSKMAKKETTTTKSIFKTTESNGIKKTSQQSATKTVKLSTRKIEIEKRPGAYVRDPASMAVTLATIKEEPEVADNSAMADDFDTVEEGTTKSQKMVSESKEEEMEEYDPDCDFSEFL